MCKVTCFHFTCAHKVKLRRSRCGGTYHRARRNGTSTACTAEAYIDIKLSTDCGPCQQEEWDERWKAKLSRAKKFLDTAAELQMPGVGVVEELVKNLEDEYQTASWAIRTRFPPGHKGGVKKVEKGEKVRKPSRLAHEVRPEDVVSERDMRPSLEPEAPADSFYCGSVSYDGSGDINYENPLYSVDASWVDDFLSKGDVGVAVHADLDFTGRWGSACKWDTSDNTSEREGEDGIQKEQGSYGLFAWGPDAKNQPSSATISMHGLMTEEDYSRRRTDEVIRAFWQVVEPENANHSVHTQYITSKKCEPPSHLCLAPEPAFDHYYKLTNGAGSAALAFASSNPAKVSLTAAESEQPSKNQPNCTI